MLTMMVERVAALEAENDQLRAEVAELRDDIAAAKFALRVAWGLLSDKSGESDAIDEHPSAVLPDLRVDVDGVD